jgi:hypothetical protein
VPTGAVCSRCAQPSAPTPSSWVPYRNSEALSIPLTITVSAVGEYSGWHSDCDHESELVSELRSHGVIEQILPSSRRVNTSVKY